MLRGRALRTSTQGRFEQAAVALEVDEVHFETSYTPMPAAAVANRPRLFAPSVRFRVHILRAGTEENQQTKILTVDLDCQLQCI
jgi:hypothetical protein